jgi:opacity protein-like surface antigen
VTLIDRQSSRRKAAVAFLAALVGLAAHSPALAIERLSPDVFAGYSFTKIEDVSRHGANLAAGFHLFGPLSAFADASAHWGAQDSLDRSDLTLMAGPGVRLGKPGGIVFFLRGLAGLVTDRASIAVLDVDIAESSSRFGVMAGGGVDAPFASRWAVRAQADWLWNDLPEGIAALPPGGGEYNGPKETGFRASAGIVYRFGSRP